jgi:hypothetical protein
MRLDSNLFTMASDFFRIKSEAKVNNSVFVATAVVHRQQHAETGKWTCKIISYQTES